jgi:hypothetical protein
MNYLQLKTVSTLRYALRERAWAARDWKPNNGIDRIEIEASELDGDPKMAALVDRFDCKAERKLSIFRFLPHTCHAWHTDLQRYAAINMLLDGWDSLTMFGVRKDAINYVAVDRLLYESDRYYLLNSKRQHTVINFANTRYLLSIGIPERYSFMDVVNYINEEGA